MLDVRGLTVAFDDKTVLNAIDLHVEKGEIVCLLGPSGCGKTTLLRVIAGLERFLKGELQIEGESIANVPVYQRGFGLMFQDFALFPHMTVAKNVMFGLRMQGVSRSEQQNRMHKMLELVGLSGFENRDVVQLSGGEKQRVALARSLAPKPRLLMLDEPLGALDAGLRERLVVELRHIIKSVGLTAIYVTHDQQEAFAIADRVAVMNIGRIEQIDTPEAVYRCPKTEFVARFLGLTNILPVTGYHDGIADTPIGAFAVETDASPYALLVHLDGVRVEESGPFSAEVTEFVFQGDVYRVQAKLGDAVFKFNLPRLGQHRVQVGQQIRLNIDPNAVIPLQQANP